MCFKYKFSFREVRSLPGQEKRLWKDLLSFIRGHGGEDCQNHEHYILIQILTS